MAAVGTAFALNKRVSAMAGTVFALILMVSGAAALGSMGHCIGKWARVARCLLRACHDTRT